VVDTPIPNGVAQLEDDDWVMFDDDASMGGYKITEVDPVPDLQTELILNNTWTMMIFSFLSPLHRPQLLLHIALK
jgi:hypothetical protein